jgi:hypothetical protein
MALPQYLGEMPGRFNPNSYARAAGCRGYGLTARFENKQDTYLWIVLFKDGERIWDCNPEFFASHFINTENT